jgi:hypothetical protein
MIRKIPTWLICYELHLKRSRRLEQEIKLLILLLEEDLNHQLFKKKELDGHFKFLKEIFYHMCPLIIMARWKKLILLVIWLIDFFKQVSEERLKMIVITMEKKDLIWQVLY